MKGGNFVGLTLLTMFLSSCFRSDYSETPLSMTPAEVAEIFSQEAQFAIGETVLQVPLVSVIDFDHTNVIIPCDQDRDEIRYCALPYGSIVENVEKGKVPIPVSGLHVNLEGYDRFRQETVQSYDQMRNKLCPQLPQQWARESCLEFGENALGIKTSRFSLIHPDHIALLENRFISINGSLESEAAVIKRLDLTKNDPQRACGKDENGNPTSLCMTTLRLDENLLAVWITSRGKTMADLRQESQLIKAFIKHGISEPENYPALKEAVERLNPS